MKRFPTILDWARKLNGSPKLIKEIEDKSRMIESYRVTTDMFSCLPWTEDGKKEIAQKAVFASRGDSV